MGNYDHLYALIIGIDKYQHQNRLRGSVKDAIGFKTFLVKNLKVPEVQIKELHDDKATRQTILDEIEALKKVKLKEPAIVIFFAGHGASAPAPTGWNTRKSQVEMICPVDMGGPLEGNDVRKREGIADFLLAELVNKISQKQGDNITIIFDCCHSAGANRGGDRPAEVQPRRANNVPPITLDEDFAYMESSQRGASFHPKFRGQGVESHVFLAACGRDEDAKDTPDGGYFTTELLRVLQAGNPREMTYDGLRSLFKLREKGQNPEVDGNNVRRFLFTTQTGVDIGWQGHRDGKSLVLEAGVSHGIHSGSKMSIYADKVGFAGAAPLGEFYAEPITALTSSLSPVDQNIRISALPDVFWARHSHVSRYRVWSSDRKTLKSLVDDSKLSDKIRVVESYERAELRVEFSHGKIQFYRREDDPARSRTALGRRFRWTSQHTDGEIIYRVAKHYRRWMHYYLRNTDANDPHSGFLDGMVPVSLELRAQDTNDGHWTHDYSEFVPNDTNSPNLIKNDKATIHLPRSRGGAQDTKYSLTLVNDAGRALYPYLFYLDASDLSVLKCYHPPLAAGQDGRGKVDAPLLAKGEMTIQSDSVGGLPLKFNDSDDIGFFKLFITGVPTDYQHMEQTTPFRDDVRGDERPLYPKYEMNLWGTKLVKVVIEAS